MLADITISDFRILFLLTIAVVTKAPFRSFYLICMECRVSMVPSFDRASAVWQGWANGRRPASHLCPLACQNRGCFQIIKVVSIRHRT